MSLPDCEPYSEAACRAASLKAGFKLGSDGFAFAAETYTVKGCYAYTEGPYTGEAYFGAGGSTAEMSAPTPSVGNNRVRPVGHDCVVSARNPRNPRHFDTSEGGRVHVQVDPNSQQLCNTSLCLTKR